MSPVIRSHLHGRSVAGPFGLATLGIATLAALAACSPPQPPKELVDARNEYAIAQTGPAPQETPAELHDAQVALARAERTYGDKGDSPASRDQAYVALRKTQLAESAARAQMAYKAKEEADENTRRVQAAYLDRTRSQLQSSQAQLQNSQQSLAKTQEQLEHEKTARAEAEKKAAQAMADLQKIASVKQESRGMVITLSGAVLFKSNEATLLPSAVVKLNEVAEALIKGNPDANMTVEGHTDSQGSRDYNMSLAARRAEAVKAQLVSRGVAADRIKTAGVGPDRPIAENTTAEGRANNRRVEIVVEGQGQPSSMAH